MLTIRKISSSEKKLRNALLTSRDISLSDDVGDIAGVFDENNELAATGTLEANVIKYVAVNAKFEGEGLVAQVITFLIKIAAERGIWHLLLYTKASEADKFPGFELIAKSDESALLEWGSPNVADFCKRLNDIRISDEAEKRGVCVMNCNPFTLGHRYLIEQASTRCDILYIIVVEENLSDFPFKLRLEMVQEGTADLKNVRVLSGGEYVISAASFPSYFIKDRGDEKIAMIHARLDLSIFAARIAPSLGIGTRFVGTEPFCRVTSVYNAEMKKILTHHGIKVREIERLEKNGSAVSASRVRQLLTLRDYLNIKEMVPESTLQILMRNSF